MDLTPASAPRSDQLNADDLIGHTATVTIERVDEGSQEQPVNVHLVEFPGRPFRPSKSMIRVFIAAWGPESSAYAGRRMTLYRDPDVRFGRDVVGGIRISHMSDLPDGKRLTLALTVTRGQRKPYVVEPLTETARPARPARTPRADAPTPEQMRALGDGFAAAMIVSGPDKARFVNKTIGRETKGWDDLSAADVEQVIAALAEISGGAA